LVAAEVERRLITLALALAVEVLGGEAVLQSPRGLPTQLLWALVETLELTEALVGIATSSALTRFAEAAVLAHFLTIHLTQQAEPSSETAEAPEVLVAVGALPPHPVVVEVLVDTLALEAVVVVDWVV
jgi:hypothetical protein